MQRHVSSLPISNYLKAKLEKGGVSSVNELKSMKPTDILKDCNITKAELTEIYETIGMFKSSKLVSVYDLLKEEDEQQDQINHITLLSDGLDSILGGGIPIRKITEVCGAAGVGKTQLCMQLCVSVQIPVNLNGMASKAVYIDTEGSFVRSRLQEIANSIKEFLEAKFHLSKTNDILSEFTVEKILKNIYYCRCHDHVQLVSTINGLKNLIERDPKIKLVILDSLASPFRFVDYKDTNSLAMKTNLLNNLMTNAYELIKTQKLAFLITNQMTTRIVKDAQSNTTTSSLVPALGESWAHCANIRLLLSWKNNKRFASVVKSSYLPDKTIGYKITSAGLKDMIEKTTRDEEEDNESQQEEYSILTNQVKRKREMDNYSY